MKTITLRFKNHPAVSMPIKAQFRFSGFTWCIHWPVRYWNEDKPPMILKHSWECSEIKTGGTIPLQSARGELPKTIIEAKTRAMERLSDKIDQIGETEFKRIITEAQNTINKQ